MPNIGHAMKQAYPGADPHKDNNAVAFAFFRKGEEPMLCGPFSADLDAVERVSRCGS